MVSKDVNITIALRVELPKLFTITSTAYEVILLQHRTLIGQVH